MREFQSDLGLPDPSQALDGYWACGQVCRQLPKYSIAASERRVMGWQIIQDQGCPAYFAGRGRHRHVGGLCRFALFWP